MAGKPPVAPASATLSGSIQITLFVIMAAALAVLAFVAASLVLIR